MDRGSWHYIWDSDQDHPQEKEMQKGKLVVWESLTKSWEKKRNKRQRRRYTHLNVVFQRINSVQSLSRVRTLQPHGLQHTRPPCPSPTPGICSNSCSLSQWCHPTILSSVVPFSSHLQSFPSSGSFQMSQLFASGGQSTGVSASTSVPFNILFQRIARRDKKAFPREQCKEIEETVEWERLEISSIKLEIPREHFMQRWAQ